MPIIPPSKKSLMIQPSTRLKGDSDYTFRRSYNLPFEVPELVMELLTAIIYGDESAVPALHDCMVELNMTEHLKAFAISMKAADILYLFGIGRCSCTWSNPPAFRAGGCDECFGSKFSMVKERKGVLKTFPFPPKNMRRKVII